MTVSGFEKGDWCCIEFSEILNSWLVSLRDCWRSDLTNWLQSSSCTWSIDLLLFPGNLSVDLSCWLSSCCIYLRIVLDGWFVGISFVPLKYGFIGIGKASFSTNSSSFPKDLENGFWRYWNDTIMQNLIQRNLILWLNEWFPLKKLSKFDSRRNRKSE